MLGHFGAFGVKNRKSPKAVITEALESLKTLFQAYAVVFIQ